MAVVTTGSTVYGCVAGLANHMKGVAEIMSVQGDPNNIVTPFKGTSTASGGTIAYDEAGNQFYQNIGGASGATWIKLGSVA